jgi:aerobic C4-dicarboxylate transport protein
MSEARALTNLIGNGVATLVVAKLTGDLDTTRMQRVLDRETSEEAGEPEFVLDQVDQRMPRTGQIRHAEAITDTDR